MASTKKSIHVYDYVVIGAGLTGLSMAVSISAQTQNVLLIDPNETFGGINKTVSTPIGNTNNGLRFLPHTGASQRALNFLESLLGTSLSRQECDNSPITFESGGFIPFVGFGQNAPALHQEFAYFLSPQKIQLAVDVHEWMSLLSHQYRGETLFRSHVTKFNSSSQKIDSLLVNGQKEIFAQNFIFCGPIRELIRLLPEDLVINKIRQKVAKSDFCSAVCLDLIHGKQITEQMNMHLLTGTTQDEIGPCVGLFHPPTMLEGQTVQLSQWVTFVDDVLEDENEVISSSLKKIKRQIKRAYPSALEQISYDRIVLAPSMGGQVDLKLNNPFNISLADNLFFAQAGPNREKNLVGSLLQSEALATHLCFTKSESSALDFSQVETSI